MERTQIFSILKELIADLLNVSVAEISERSYLSDLGAESIDIVNMVMRIEERFGLDEIEDEDVQELQTVGEVVDYLVIMLRASK